MKDSFNIKNDDHFKLWIELKDKIIFEDLLIKNSIPFHIDENQSTLGSNIRYFFPDEYKVAVDAIVKSIQIPSSTDTIHVYNPSDSKRIYKIYLLIVIAIAVLLCIASLLLD